MILRTITNKHHWHPPSQGVKSWGPHPTQGRWVWAAALSCKNGCWRRTPAVAMDWNSSQLDFRLWNKKWWSCVKETALEPKEEAEHSVFLHTHPFSDLSNVSKNISGVLRWFGSKKNIKKSQDTPSPCKSRSGLLSGPPPAPLGLRPCHSLLGD